MERINEMLGAVWLGNPVKAWIAAVLIAVLGNLALWLAKKIAVSRLAKLASDSGNAVIGFMLKTVNKGLMPLLYIGVFFLAMSGLNIGAKAGKFLQTAWVAAATVIILGFVTSLVEFLITGIITKRSNDQAGVKSLKGLIVLIKVVIWGLGIVLLLDNLGYKVSAVLAGLGIGGIAVALAAQAILGDLFSYISITFDRPFETGDFIIVGDLKGTVENVGIKTTRIRSLDGEELIFSNSDLTNSRIRNYKRMYNRRVVFGIGVTYDTGLEKLKKLPAVFRQIVESVKDTKFDRAHFASYGDFSQNFEIVYYVMGGDYNKYMDIQQEINFKIREELEKLGVEFAFPTQTLYVKK